MDEAIAERTKDMPITESLRAYVGANGGWDGFEVGGWLGGLAADLLDGFAGTLQEAMEGACDVPNELMLDALMTTQLCAALEKGSADGFGKADIDELDRWMQRLFLGVQLELVGRSGLLEMDMLPSVTGLDEPVVKLTGKGVERLALTAWIPTVEDQACFAGDLQHLPTRRLN